MTGSDWTQAAVAFGTLAAVVVAIWGDWFRSKLAAPKLEVHLRDPEGELAKNADGKKVRFYHIDVSNTRKWAHAKGVRVLMKRIDVLSVDDQWRPAMEYGPIPLLWKFGVAPSSIADGDDYFLGQG